MLILGVSLTQNEGIVEEYDLAIDVLYVDPERFSTTVNLLVPSEVRRDGKVDAKKRACNGLNLRLQSESIGEYWPEDDAAALTEA